MEVLRWDFTFPELWKPRIDLCSKEMKRYIIQLDEIECYQDITEALHNSKLWLSTDIIATIATEYLKWLK